MTSISEELKMNFIDGRCSDEELRTVLQWIEESDDNAREIFELEQISMTARGLKNDTQQAVRIMDMVNRKIEDSMWRQKRLRRMRWYHWSAAAAIFIGAVLCVTFLLNKPAVEMVNLTAENGCMTVTLPDSSKVWLNRSASISYPATFAENSRKVSIDGEVYFEVSKDKSRPFTVEGKWLNVTVLGTKFNFNSSSDKENTVSLLEGRVEVKPVKNKDGVVLAPGQKVEFNPSDGRMSVMQANTALDVVWHDRLIHFHNATVSEIVADLEKLYPVEIIVKNSVDRQFTYSGATVYYQTADSTLEALCETLPLKITRHGDKIIINSK